VHGDLKPENVLLAGDCTLKIADFGQSQFFEKKDTFNRTLGTPAFLREWGLGRLWLWLAGWPGWQHCRSLGSIEGHCCYIPPVQNKPACTACARMQPLSAAAAPEVCAGGAYHGRHADMWALGVSLYLFMYGEMPFKVRVLLF
jgi:serine/threonine protein kinase